MSTDLVLRRREGGPFLSVPTIEKALEGLAKTSPIHASLADSGTVIRFRIRLLVGKAPGVAVSIARNGSKATGSTPNRSASLLYWCFHALAEILECELEDPQEDTKTPPNPGEFEEAALELVRAHEANQDHANDDDQDSAADDLLAGFLEWLVEAGKLSLACDAPSELSDLEHLLAKPTDLYEALFDSPKVDELFVSEREFLDLLRSYRART